MPVVFPQMGNDFFPLPADYPELVSEGQRLARVNAVQLQGRPDLEVAAWAFSKLTTSFLLLLVSSTSMGRCDPQICTIGGSITGRVLNCP